MENAIIFYTISFFIFAFLLTFLICKKLFNALITSFFIFVFVSFIFYLLGTEYNAIIQVSVYGIAIPVILGLSIMYNQENKYETPYSTTFLHYLIITGCPFVFLSLYFLITNDASLSIFNTDDFSIYNNSFYLISTTLFNNYILAFELISIVLTIAVIGFSVFKKEIKK